MYYIGNAVTDIGNVKKVNQDSLTLKIANTRWGQVAFAVMCDGLGGLEQGEVASATVIRAFEEWFIEIFPYEKGNWTQEMIEESWKRLLNSINQEICAYGKEHKIELGTTITAVLFLENQYYVIHVGDCRLYEIKDTIKCMTKDQTVIQKEIDEGKMTPEQAKTDSRRNVLLQCIGISENIIPEFFSNEIKEECCYLICSDGFRHEVSEMELSKLVNPAENKTRESIRQNLVHLTVINKERGERDNLSAILIRTKREKE